MAEETPKSEKMEKAEKKKPLAQPKAPQTKGPRRLGNIVRVAETNLDGSRPVRVAIRGIPGVGFMMSHAIAGVTGLGDRKLESLSPEEMKRLGEAIQNPGALSVPSWMLNRRKDPQRGTDRHLVSSSLDLTRKMDINEMKKLKTYKGIRHSYGLPVRGQRTRSTFRTGKTVGVKRQKQAPGVAKKE